LVVSYSILLFEKYIVTPHLLLSLPHLLTSLPLISHPPYLSLSATLLLSLPSLLYLSLPLPAALKPVGRLYGTGCRKSLYVTVTSLCLLLRYNSRRVFNRTTVNIQSIPVTVTLNLDFLLSVFSSFLSLYFSYTFYPIFQFLNPLPLVPLFSLPFLYLVEFC
jgi:hypothetical protein